MVRDKLDVLIETIRKRLRKKALGIYLGRQEYLMLCLELGVDEVKSYKGFKIETI